MTPPENNRIESLPDLLAPVLIKNRLTRHQGTSLWLWEEPSS